MVRPSAARWPLAVIVALATSGLARADDWDPERTWVFAIGCTEWKFWKEANFPKKGREDVAFVNTLHDRGVPAEQVVFLKDRQGTLDTIKKRFVEQLKKTREGDCLIFYFQGHGGRDIDGNTSTYYFINYDAYDPDRGDDSFLFMGAVFDLIEKHFRGSHVMVFADCCCSGGILVEARKRAGGEKPKSRIAYACLASTAAHMGSSGAWTYTDALIRGFRGDPVMDRNGNGTVTFRELAQRVEEEMAFVEDQKAVWVVLNGFDVRLGLSAAEAKPHPAVGQFLEAEWNPGEWYRAVVLEAKGKRLRVRYTDGDEAWVQRSETREFSPEEWEAGAEVLAQGEDDKWYPARVLRAYLGLHQVHWDGAPASLNGWIPPGRIKPRP